MNDATAWLCIAVPIIAIIAIMVARSNSATAQANALLNTRTAYEKALNDLRDRPTDPQLRQSALAAGRHYSSVSRENKGATIFDEVALKNDLDAATAGAVTVAAPATPSPVIPVADRLRQLDGLRSQGLITDAEYQARRAKILEDV
jgi:hypothetical protein